MIGFGLLVLASTVVMLWLIGLAYSGESVPFTVRKAASQFTVIMVSLSLLLIVAGMLRS